MRPAQATQCAFSVARDVHAVGAFIDQLAVWLFAHRIHEDVVRPLQVVLDEVLANLIRHDQQEAEPVFIESELLAGHIALRLRYRSRPFDQSKAPQPDLKAPVTTRPVGGLGLVLVNQLMDSVEYAHHAPYSELRLQKRLP
jgi:serine/threonine-protein kinase RsbW